VPTVKRARSIAAERDALWAIVSDPYHLPRWWPSVQRVEDASAEAWTKVLRSPKGRAIRADYTRVSADPPAKLVWRQEVEESPFERILREAVTEISLEPVNGATRVELRSTQRLRGLARFGSFMVRRATARLLEEALTGLERAAVP
jgi:uncharacterized protein YndB with AHSA1/START domain